MRKSGVIEIYQCASRFHTRLMVGLLVIIILCLIGITATERFQERRAEIQEAEERLKKYDIIIRDYEGIRAELLTEIARQQFIIEQYQTLTFLPPKTKKSRGPSGPLVLCGGR